MFDVAYFFDSFWRLLPALPMTLMLSVVSFAVGCVLGFLLALARLGRFAVLRSFVALFVSFFRGTPLLVQLFLFYYGIPIAFMAMGTTVDYTHL
ncbi:MAG: ABC transporter permease subunit, partial [Helicobacter sp.]|nr:ABC transporter permease subunit [Helicobacter sp.]